MAKLQTRHILCGLAILAAPPLAVSAQQAPVEPPPAEKSGPPGATAPSPDVAPSQRTPVVKPSEAPATQAAQDLVGLNVFSSDGTRVGEVRSVRTGPSGDIIALRIHSGGFLGFGGRIVAIPQGKFIRSGHSIRLDFDSDEVKRLPEVSD
jgi:sporulation protein YlmC with PRC-barrel domain